MGDICCTQCEAPLVEGDAFCSACGARQADTVAALPSSKGRSVFAVLVALIFNAGLFLGSAYGVYRILSSRRPVRPTLRLGVARPVAHGPGTGTGTGTAAGADDGVFEWPSWWTFPPDGKTPKVSTRRRARSGRTPVRRRRARVGRRIGSAASVRAGSGAGSAPGGDDGSGSGTSAGGGVGSGGVAGSDHGGSDHGGTAAGLGTGTGSSSPPASAAGSGQGAGSGSGSGSASTPPAALSAIDRKRAQLDAGSIRLVVRQNLPRIQACYDRANKGRTTINGRVEIRFVVRANGTVKSAVVHANSTGHKGLGKCIAYTMSRWRFPRPTAGEDAEFIYPFVFASG